MEIFRFHYCVILNVRWDVTNKYFKIKMKITKFIFIFYVGVYNAVNNKERPNYLSRSKNNSTGLDEPVKSKFT